MRNGKGQTAVTGWPLNLNRPARGRPLPGEHPTLPVGLGKSIARRSQPTGNATMSTSNAEMYGRRARDAQDFKDVGNNVKRAVDELIRAIKALETRVSRLEAGAR
jgi:hypothetical protein